MAGSSPCSARAMPTGSCASIVDSVTKSGEPQVYSSIAKCVDSLQLEAADDHSKWLVVLTDTVDFECVDANDKFDKQSPQRAEAKADALIEKMRAISGLNLVIIDASGIANFNAKHTMWPTWHRLSHKLTDQCGDDNSGINIAAANVSEIDEAFEKV